MLDEREKPPLVGDGLSELCQAGSFDNPEVKRFADTVDDSIPF
jgi:hypothetical protein